MVYINNSNNVRSYGRSGMLGLATGMDTESVIEGMLQPTQMKIDKQLGLKQQIQWKQDIYRSMISKVTTLQRNYFDALNPKTNLLAASFFTSKQVTSSSSAVNATATSHAQASLTIDHIQQLAQPTSASSHQRVSQDVVLSVNESLLQDQNEITVTLDGVTKKLSISKGSQSEVLAQLQSEVTRNLGNGLTVLETGQLVATGNRLFTVSGNAETLQAFGLSSATSNYVTLNTRLSESNFATKLAGDTFKIRINQTDLTFSSSDTIATVINQINQSSAGVSIFYSNISDTFTLTSKTLGQGVSIEFEDLTGNLMQSLFQSGTTSSVSSSKLKQVTPMVSNSLNAELIDYTQPWKMNVDGVDYSFELPTLEDSQEYTIESAIAALNQQFDSAFGKDVIALTYDGVEQAQVSFKGRLVSFEDTPGLQSDFGFANQDNQVSLSTRLSDIGITGQLSILGINSAFSDASTVEELLVYLQEQDIQAEFTEGRIHLSTTKQLEITGSGNLLNTLFSTSSIAMNQESSPLNLTDGKNAILSVNGVEIERNTNIFEVQNYRLTLNQTSNTPVTLSAKSNLDDTVAGIKGFIEEYNQLISQIHTLTQEKSEFRDYRPLTEAQKKDMGEKEAELWEEKAKTGLVRNDAVLTGLATSLRQILFLKPEGSSLSLADIGITTGNYSDRGRLSIDETKLRQALETDGEAVSKLFTDKEQGVAVRFNQTMQQAVRQSITQPGSLVRLAGIANSSSAVKNNLSDRMVNIDRLIENLRRTYESQRERYWKQFSQLESVISKMNSQSSWLQQQLG